MFKNSLFLGITASIVATIACLIYAKFYMGVLYDFSMLFDLVKVISYYMIFGVSAAVVQFGLNYLIKNKKWADLILNLLISVVTIGSVLYIMKMDDPQELYDWEKYPDFEYCCDFFKGFITPMLFFPALGWFTFKPLFSK